MNIENFLTETNQTANAFADKHKIPATTVWRAVKRKTLRPSNATRISNATGGAVSVMELLFPDQREGA